MPSVKKPENPREPFIFKDPTKGVKHKQIIQITPAKEGESKVITIIHCKVKNSLVKCKEGSKNSERVFIKGDIVDIIYLSMKDFREMNDVKAWIVVTKGKEDKHGVIKKRLWWRPVKTLRDMLEDPRVERVRLNAVEHAYVHGKRRVKDHMKCTSFMYQDEIKFWIEDGEREEEEEEEEEEEGTNFEGNSGNDEEENLENPDKEHDADEQRTPYIRESTFSYLSEGTTNVEPPQDDIYNNHAINGLSDMHNMHDTQYTNVIFLPWTYVGGYGNFYSF